MNTLFAVLLFIVLISWYGLGPTLMLLPRRLDRPRILLIPFVGLSSGILVSLALAGFGFEGQTIAAICFIVLSTIALLGLRFSPLKLDELRRTWPVLLIAALSTAFVGWPLFRLGFDRYWGYANPDEAYLTPIMLWIRKHPFGVPPYYQNPFAFFGGVPQNSVMGIFYLVVAVSVVMRTTPDLLFSVTQAVLLFLVPIASYLLATALGLPFRRAITVCGVISVSSLVGYTFYLDSMGTLSVIAVIPVVIALAHDFGESAAVRSAALFAIVSGAMFYNYLGSVALIAVEVPAVCAWLLVSRRQSFRRLSIFLAMLIAAVAVVFPAFAYSTVRIFFQQSVSNQAAVSAVSAAAAELLQPFAWVLTEHGVPFFWGFEIPGVAVLGHVSNSYWPEICMLAGGLLCSALLVSAFWRRVSGLSGSFAWIAGAALLPILIYGARTIGYGVFKLVTWIHPIMVIGLVGALAGLSDIARRSRFRSLAVLPWLVMFGYIGVNAELTYRLGTYTQSKPKPGSPHGLPGVPFTDVHQLTEIGPTVSRAGVAVMVPNVVAERWAEAYLFAASASPESFPNLRLETDDSVPRLDREPFKQAYALHWRTGDFDIVPPVEGIPAWSNTTFSVSRVEDLSNALILGLGWYRPEEFPQSVESWRRRFRWVRKRAEFLIINPRSTPQRLLLTLSAGYGNPSPERHVSFFLNGQKFDEISLHGYARVVTKPFVLVPPWSQVEFEIAETAAPLSRRNPIWAHWVPQDPRRLNVAVSEVALIGPKSAPLPSYLNMAAELRAHQGLMDGIYPDRWVGDGATIELQPLSETARLEVSGFLPAAAGISLPYHIDFSVDGQPAGAIVIDRFGAFHEVASTSPAFVKSHVGQVVQLHLQPSATFTGSNGDQRRLSVQLEEIGFR